MKSKKVFYFSTKVLTQRHVLKSYNLNKFMWLLGILQSVNFHFILAKSDAHKVSKKGLKGK